MIWRHVRTFLSVFLFSSLIWIFAERQVATDHIVEIHFNLPAEQPEVLVQFVDQTGQVSDQTSVSVKARIEGPAGRIQAIKDEQPTFNFELNLQELGYDPQADGPQNLNVRIADVMDNQLPYQDVVLPLSEPNPDLLHVQATPLELRDLPVKVFDAVGTELAQAQTSPATVPGYVLPDQPLEARIYLTVEEETRATRQAITMRINTPERVLEPTVTIQLPERGLVWTDTRVIKTPRVGLVMAPGIQGRYKVVLDEDILLSEPITCRGSALAVKAYAETPFHLLLEVKPEDKPGAPIDRPLRYNAPEEHDDFEIVDRKRILMRFHLEPIESRE